ncbi:2-methylaconitate cis-trans-isomerase PrpF [Rhodopseudomonas julia]|uniref:2-methylaconitate cis-trans-isomerase PrpF n=1 Tax=Rhodopseudomonas julia TaxID=200617 RepID=A0ABU0CA76_9BRAD|nr:PrpF domain-containing protein [Rhodopseudomonas julia]MDQ0327435.1 2-methylaconitate cis-trans-isomerase PrpF [Rhodopseudomonas julia]
MTQQRIPAVFMRGGTSKAIMLKEQDLPEDRALWPSLFRKMLGSPDPNGRQLDGLGGGISSLSKICVIGPSTRPDADVDYTFAQVAVKTDEVDFSGNCGNMSSAVGPFAVDEEMVAAPRDGEATVRIHNTNTGKIIRSVFRMAEGEATVEGDAALPGVAGTGAPVRLEFLHPAGTRGNGLLPAGEALTQLTKRDGSVVEASLIDAAIPTCFLPAAALGVDPTIMPDALDASGDVLEEIEHLRRQASVAMGIASNIDEAAKIIAIPKIGFVAAPAPFSDLSGSALAPGDFDILVRMISAGQPHRAVPITCSLALASAAAVEGSVVRSLLKPETELSRLRLGTPSGIVTVGVKVNGEDAGVPVIEAAHVLRTQRRLMEGAVCIPNPS